MFIQRFFGAILTVLEWMMIVGRWRIFMAALNDCHLWWLTQDVVEQIKTGLFLPAESEAQRHLDEHRSPKSQSFLVIPKLMMFICKHSKGLWLLRSAVRNVIHHLPVCRAFSWDRPNVTAVMLCTVFKNLTEAERRHHLVLNAPLVLMIRVGLC